LRICIRVKTGPRVISKDSISHPPREGTWGWSWEENGRKVRLTSQNDCRSQRPDAGKAFRLGRQPVYGYFAATGFGFASIPISTVTKTVANKISPRQYWRVRKPGGEHSSSPATDVDKKDPAPLSVGEKFGGAGNRGAWLLNPAELYGARRNSTESPGSCDQEMLVGPLKYLRGHHLILSFDRMIQVDFVGSSSNQEIRRFLKENDAADCQASDFRHRERDGRRRNLFNFIRLLVAGRTGNAPGQVPQTRQYCSGGKTLLQNWFR